ncbi:MAG: LCP family protein [Actinomycetota bacterium]|nr:LCP family protein [Actinomycetota bacterium]
MTEQYPAGDDGAAGESQQPLTTSPTPRRGPALTVRIVLIVAAVAVLAVTGTAWVIRHRADVAISQHRVDALVPNDPNIKQGTPDKTAGPPTGTAGSTGSTGSAGSNGSTAAPGAAGRPVSPQDAAAMPAENMLVLGLDTRGNATGGVGPGTSQSDVIMIAHLYAGHQQMSVLSIPRDLYVPAPTCKEWDNATGQVSDHNFTSQYTSWKITNAYSVGGPRCTVQAVQALTGLRIDRLITIQFDGFKSIVDALGGVQMTFATPVIDQNQGTVIAAPGSQLVNGTQALALVRSREVKGDSSGDLGRIDRQQQLLKAMMRKMVTSGTLTDPAKLDRVMQTFIANSTTDNVTTDQLLSLARKFAGGSAVKFVTLPTTPAPGTDGLHGTGSDAQIFTALVNDQPIPVVAAS